MTNSFFKWSMLLLLGSLFLGSCGEDDPITPDPKYENGVFIANEGPFGTGTGTVSFWNRSTGAVEQDLFQTANNAPLGNIVQSVTPFLDKVYIVVNNANKLEVVQKADFKSVATISGLEMPRYFLGVDSTKGYVSQWGADGLTGSVKVIDLATNTVIKTIPTGKGPERMIHKGGFVLVVNSGGFGVDSTLTVIDATTDEVNQTITVGHNPNSFRLFGANFLVLCGGINDWQNPANSTPGTVWRISGFSPSQFLTFPSAVSHPEDLISTTDSRYFCLYEGKIYEIEIEGLNFSLSANPISPKSFYSMDIEPETDIIFAADPLDYQSNGFIFRYQPTGVLIDSFQVGIIPSNFGF